MHRRPTIAAARRPRCADPSWPFAQSWHATPRPSCCSTGEEPWSAAIALREAGRAGEILATDVDTDALETARRGVYRIQVLQSAGFERLAPHFIKGTGANAELALVRPELRAMVRFAQRNLLGDGSWPSGERFDAVFCRNVMIYFDPPTQRRVLQGMHAAMRPGGLLYVGHSENFTDARALFRLRGKTIYERL